MRLILKCARYFSKKGQGKPKKEIDP
jgi:methionyl-tRNA synthetase